MKEWLIALGITFIAIAGGFLYFRLFDSHSPKDLRAIEINRQLDELAQESEAGLKDVEYVTRKIELGEYSTEEGELKLKARKNVLEQIASERKRLQNELYEIETNTWQPR